MSRSSLPDVVKEIFKIIVVDDRPETMKRPMEKIRVYLESRDFEAKIDFDHDGSLLQKSLDEEHIDIVVTDMNIAALGEKKGGQKIIEMVRSRHNLTDILFYSADSYDAEEVRKQTGHYLFIEYIDRSQVVEYLQTLIDKNLARLNDIVFLRGLVITKIIDLEFIINEIVANYFGISGSVRDKFTSLIMENRSFGLEGRIEVLIRIMVDRQIVELTSGGNHKIKDKTFGDPIQTLKNLQKDRNLMAHCRSDRATNSLISWGKEVKFTREKMIKLVRSAQEAATQLKQLRTFLLQ